MNHPTGPSKQPASLVSRINNAHIMGTVVTSRAILDDANEVLSAEAATLSDVAVTLVFVNATIPQHVTVYRVDSSHANALPVYNAAGAPDYPNATLMAALQHASEMMPETVTPTPLSSASADATSADDMGSWKVTVAMPAYSVAVLSW